MLTQLLLADTKLAVTGVDSEPKMIKKARERLTVELASGRLKIVLDDALHFLTNQPSHAFDVIASGYVLHNLMADYRARLYAEIWRMLAPSGLFINADKYAQTGEAHREAPAGTGSSNLKRRPRASWRALNEAPGRTERG